MDNLKSDKEAVERGENMPATSEASTPATTDSKQRKATDLSTKVKAQKSKARASRKSSKSKVKKKAKEAILSSDESDSDSSEDDTDDEVEETSSDSSDDSDSETEKQKKKKRKLKEKKAKQKSKYKKKANSKRKAQKEVHKLLGTMILDNEMLTTQQVSSDSDSTDSLSDSEAKTDADEDTEVDDQLEQIMAQIQLLQQQQQQQLLQPPPVSNHQLGYLGGAGLGRAGRGGLGRAGRGGAAALARVSARNKAKQLQALGLDLSGKKAGKDKNGKKKRASKLEFKRVDQLWDSTIHNYKLTDTAEDQESSEYDQYLFNVRRTFDWEGKYKNTVVDIKSKLIKEALNEVMDGVKGVSLVEETPSVDPNLLFLYLEDLRKSMKELKAKIKGGEKMKKKIKKKNETKRKHVKVLLKYLDMDYAEVKKTLYPMLESGLITFDLLWALYKPNTLAYTTTYATIDEPRAFKIEYAEKEFSFMKGEWYNIEGKYLEYDGKTWGMGSMDCDVPSFKGARKITSLNCYPLQYHKEEEKLRKELIERGKKFVSLQGVHYKSHEGLAYYKKKRQVIKVNINGRVMVDPAIHRRILPNYQISTVKPKDPDEVQESSDDEESDDDCDCECESDGGGHGGGVDDVEEERTKIKIVLDDKKKPHIVRIPVDEDGNEIKPEKLEEVASKDCEAKGQEEKVEENPLPVFTDEEYLIASPVVLGFAFAEKLWLEFTVSGIKDIVWNEGAYDSLVLENNTKDIVKALVESHKYHPTKSIDDVIQGKGKGLVAVLHGPPGTGKTLTAEGISELLKCPLYMVSAGELGTDSRTLEGELQKILDIAHAWGAVLLLDEADVFLEKRTIQDIHRNALVSIFLRLLEYFQGILFLTTNRVEVSSLSFHLQPP
jgi:hypothetical protein